MKKLFAAFFAVAFCLLAADFWQSKPFAEWGDKDLQKMMTNSPWAHSFNLPLALSGGGGDVGPSGEGGGGGGRGGGGGGGGEGGGAGGGGGIPPTPGGLAPMIAARWQSALPVKQAFVRLKYGAQTATSPDAQKILDREETRYAIVLSGPFRSLLRGGKPEAVKKAIMDATSLSVKGKDEVRPVEVDVAPSDILLAFPRTTPFSLDDKEVEFSTKLGDVNLKYKFKLKDMVFNGKLEM
jgi:hypothetical protein